VAEPADINGDGLVSPGDLLTLVTDLNMRGARRLPVIPTPPGFWDAGGDNIASPIDVLVVVLDITAPGGEGESARTARLDEAIFGEIQDWLVDERMKAEG